MPHGFTPRPYQQPLWDAMIHDGFTRAMTVWPRRSGKDITDINIIATKAMQRVGLYFYIAPYYTQVKSIIWNGSDGQGRRFLDYIPVPFIRKKNEAELKLELINGSIIRLCGSDNIDSIVGNNPIGIVLTEYSLHKPEVWHYLRPVLAENGGWALFNGTPRGLNHFYQLLEAAKRNKNWFVQFLTRNDTGVPSLEAIEEDRKSGMPESLIEQEYYCSFTSSSEETLIPLDLIEPCINRAVNHDYVKSSPKIMGVDVAYAEKGDKSVIARRQGSFLLPLDKFQGLDNMSLATRVGNYINDWRPHLVFIDAGRGEGVISRLHQLDFGDIVIPIHFGGKTFSDLYRLKKDEMWGRMKNWFSNPDHLASIPDDVSLITDLSAPRFWVNDKGFIQIESKKQLRSRGFSSTDSGDAVALTFAEDVDSTSTLTRQQKRFGIDSEILDSMVEENRATRERQEYELLGHMDSLGPHPLNPRSPKSGFGAY